MTPRRLPLVLIAALALILSACAASGPVTMPPGTTLIALRHADRAGDRLSEAGRARAAALPAALEGIPIDVIYSPGLERNLDTAMPLANARGLEITRIPPEGAAPRMFARSPGKTIVWVGNKGNLNEIWDALGAEDPPPLEYGDLYIVTPGRFGGVKVVRRSFGAAE